MWCCTQLINYRLQIFPVGGNDSNIVMMMYYVNKSRLGIKNNTLGKTLTVGVPLAHFQAKVEER